MTRHIYNGLTAFFILLLLSCSAAPPVEPTTGFEPYSAPPKPANLTATNGREDTIVLSWDETEGATSYQVWAVDAASYGSAGATTTRTESYATLIERGFSLLDVVYDTTYTLKEESANSSYVFSVVAMKSVRGTGKTNVLYSEPSSFVEGSTVGEIILSAVANSERVALFWDISNLYSVLDNSEEKTPLYSYSLTLYRKLSSSSEWNEGEIIGEEDRKRNSAVLRASTLDIDTEYDFRLRLDVTGDDEDVINTIESDVYTITTDSSLVPERVENVNASCGISRNEVTLTWTIPDLPDRDDITPAFRIDRTEDGTNWTALDMTPSESEGTWSVTDTTLADNTLYSYRIVNGYTLAGKNSIYQSDADAETVKNVYSLWLPENVRFVFTQGADDYHAAISVQYTYNPPVREEGTVFGIGGEKWTENNLADHISIPVAAATERGFSIESTEPLTYFSFYFVFSFNGEEILKVTNPEDVTLGVTAAEDNLIRNLTGTTNRIGTIRLSWTEAEDGEYEIYEGKVPADTSQIVEDGDTRYIDIAVADTITHNYRIKLTTSSGSFQVAEISGKALSLPCDLTASDSTSTEGIYITWTPDTDSDVTYTLQYSEDGENWTELPVTIPGEAMLPAMKDGKDGKEYLFRLSASNRNQDGITAYSESERGSAFGPALLSTRIENNGLDPEKITIVWNGVMGAKFYRIKRDGVELLGKVYTTTYTDLASTIQNLTTSPTPLSRKHTYTVIPYLDDNTPAVVTDSTESANAEGRLFAPPENVTASKGDSVGSIKVTWSEVEGAAAYRIDKYVVSLTNGETGSGSLSESITVTGTSYTDNSTVAGSRYVKYVLSSLKEDGTSSLQQTGSVTVPNSLGFDESADVGYSLHTVETLTVSSKENGGVYVPYTVITWSFVPGATSYRLTSSAGSTEIDVSSIPSYSTTAVTTNGTDEDEAGYLAYDPGTEMYTYNDNSGLLTETGITDYRITAVNGTAESDSRGNNSTVYRQPSAADWVNITLNILRPAFIAADKNFGGDWWITNGWAWKSPSESYTYGSTGMTFNLYTNSISADYPYEKNYLSISEYTDSTNNIKLATTANIQVKCSDEEEAGNLGTDPLTLIGYNGNGTISITPLDTKLTPVTVSFNSINVSTADSSGTYTVSSGDSTEEVNDDASFTRVMGE